MNFIELCLAGEVLEDEIDDFVERWHEGDSEETSLHDFLGMDWDEYSLWATNPSILKFILSAHKKKISIADELGNQRYSMAARAGSVEEAKKLEKWLKQIGYI